VLKLLINDARGSVQSHSLSSWKFYAGIADGLSNYGRYNGM
jgi:hypothetical protein